MFREFADAGETKMHVRLYRIDANRFAGPGLNINLDNFRGSVENYVLDEP